MTAPSAAKLIAKIARAYREGASRTESHYPTSAELAAFRFTLSTCYHGDRKGDPKGWRACPLSHPRRGAWAKERRNGIGHRHDGAEPWCAATIARLVSAERRSAAYARLIGFPA